MGYVPTSTYLCTCLRFCHCLANNILILVLIGDSGCQAVVACNHNRNAGSEMKFIKDFRLLLIPVGAPSSSINHCLYIKEHKGASESGRAKTLVVGNIDYCKWRTPDEIDGMMRILFSVYGKIETVSLSDVSSSSSSPQAIDQKSRFVHVQFESKKSLKAALSAEDSEYLPQCNHVMKLYGFSSSSFEPKLAKEIRRSFAFPYEDPVELEAELTDFMRNFEESELAEKRERERRSREADEDGFIMPKVRSKKKRKAADKRGNGDVRTRSKKVKTHELKNFYRFQIREEKVKKLDELRKKFEHDKEKIAVMKAQRKFKPF